MRKFLARFRQAPVFSTVYILGAALSVASVMLVAIFLHVKTSNIYPEYSRDKLLYLSKLHYNYHTTTYHGDGDGIGSFTPKHAALLADSLKSQANVFITKSGGEYTNVFVNSGLQSINLYVDGEKFEDVAYKMATPEIFNIYDYKFVEGKPFTDVTAPNVVISDRLARRIFGTDRDVIGRKIVYGVFESSILSRFNVSRKELTVCGVFKEGSRLLPNSFADIIAPLDMNKEILMEEERFKTKAGVFLDGAFELVMLPHEGVTREALREKINSLLARISSQPHVFVAYTSWRNNVAYDPITVEIEPEDYSLSIGTYPRTSMQMVLGNPTEIDEEFNMKGVSKLYGLLILILLVVPALNLSSLISGNMDSKMSEMGIRKAFGARNSTLLWQVVNENLWLTGCGALLGVLFSWIGVVLWKDWLFAGVGKEGSAALASTDVLLDPAMLFAPKVFIFAVAVCVILNLLSSVIPALLALRRPAIDAIKAKS